MVAVANFTRSQVEPEFLPLQPSTLARGGRDGVFCGNDPVNRVDYLGMSPMSDALLKVVGNIGFLRSVIANAANFGLDANAVADYQSQLAAALSLYDTLTAVASVASVTPTVRKAAASVGLTVTSIAGTAAVNATRTDGGAPTTTSFDLGGDLGSDPVAELRAYISNLRTEIEDLEEEIAAIKKNPPGIEGWELIVEEKEQKLAEAYAELGDAITVLGVLQGGDGGGDGGGSGSGTFSVGFTTRTTAPANPTQGVLITIGYTHIRGRVQDTVAAFHTYIILTDLATGASYMTRAGPSSSRSLLIAFPVQPWDENAPDTPSETVTTQRVGVVNASFSVVKAATNAFASLVNNSKIPYGAIGASLGQAGRYNSNSYTSSYLDWIGFPGVSPVTYAPGWSNGLPVPIPKRGGGQ